ncbi:metalloregulator ArsR/SmtB family transcription factor [Novosphingobium resinovorum]|jgi:ArsR family transcriptional regulator|uniref:ArsR/SmtB family transcription factor n=1 Tax=Sphingomonadaceae TaxID=41297 RepID=UPI00027CA0A7|nr:MULTISPECIES: metalloregulator ArsR/SmtB family transcription factor [Sphingomonadaceae]EJU09419.1 ArsR family transcriptional regulator [Sphingomonas sp. LH128]MBF7012668.1 metalloregulator ArsR/SmtB family transcription factor [Novosphingobium sp. HR1a]MEE4454739.1 metalloregulator ArsR/SmtB family transcription factor [Novosphingobium resinovorum]WJM27401.1 metalloregulator ArsR/SmtB family transcription factor [Novosphingobium resinovorum]
MRIDPLLRALSEPTRLRMLRLLAHMELAVGELAQVLGQSQPRVSRHIKILCDAGLAERRKEGSWVFLRIAVSEQGESSLGTAAANLLNVAERDDSQFAARCAEDRRHLAAIRAGREASAEAYFARHAAEWDTLRRLHGADEPVEAALLRALGEETIGGLLDVGTGTGRMAQLLSARAGRVTALDKSPEMLRIARARLQDLPADKVDLVQGDFTALPFAPDAFDTVLFHQVLHFAQDPAVVLTEAARVLRPGGRIAVVDLAAHEREEMRERHAHARLGFSDEQMLAHLASAGLTPAEPVALPGDPLTVKIWTARRDGVTARPENRETV